MFLAFRFVTLVALSVADVELFLRVELSFLIACLGCAAVMALLLVRQMHAGVPAESVERLLEGIEHEPLEI